MTPQYDESGDPLSFGGLKKALENARGVEDLKRLYDLVAIAQEMSRRSHGPLEEHNRLAELRLRVGRKLGSYLGDQVRRGGHGSSKAVQPQRGGSSSPLPAGISWSQSSRFQQLARISEASLRRYLAAAAERREQISLAGALRAARASRQQSAHWGRVLRSVRAAMTVDLCFGVPAEEVGAKRQADPSVPEPPLHGNVFVLATDSPREWLARLADEQRAGRVVQAMLAFRARIGAPWFERIASDDWSCCLLRRTHGASDDHAVAYRGANRLRFWQAFHGLGTVVEPAGLRYGPPASDP